MTGSVVVLCMGGIGHVQILLPLISGLTARGCVVHAMTRADFRAEIERAGGCFANLYAGRPLDAADATSIPYPTRFVSFAATYAESLCADVAALAPAAIVYDTFTLAGPVVARRLGIPYVNVCPNHAPVPARMVEALLRDPRVAISAECRAAVRRLQEAHGMSSANPFSYYEALSPHLNVYPEPAEFLGPDERAAFEPIAFFGSLLPPAARRDPDAARAFACDSGRTNVYVSFGTGVWRYFAPAALAALRAISAAFADRDAAVLISLGRGEVAADARGELVRSNVRVVDYVDQWAVLEEAGLFITHQGINSTHEAIFHEVPMISYPFFGDQPALARRCQQLGLAVPLAEPQARITAEALASALRRLAEDQGRFAARLAEARSWELRTIADRGAVLDRILSLAGVSE